MFYFNVYFRSFIGKIVYKFVIVYETEFYRYALFVTL
ncbi:hypothetical protein SAMN05720489_1921 [Fibrobacter sp. UWB13]|nr:hypothetical protein SAMN05720489_1921 [Fibrobacter sp. UWB13]